MIYFCFVFVCWLVRVAFSRGDGKMPARMSPGVASQLCHTS